MYRAIAANKRNTVFIIVLFVIIIGLLGLFADFYFDGNYGIFIGTLVGATIYTIVQYFAAGSQALSISGAKPITKAENPRLYRIVENLAITEGLPMPRVYVINDPSPNAFATGRNPENAAVAVTEGLMRILSPEEVRGVLAHEISHVRHGDLTVMRIAAAASGITRTMAQVGLIVLLLWGAGAFGAHPLLPVLLILAPLASDLLALSLSRTREFLADAGAVELTGDPAALASALTRLKVLQGDDFERLASRGPRWLRWFRTHPTIEERVAALAAAAVPAQPVLPAWDGTPWTTPPQLRRRPNPWRR